MIRFSQAALKKVDELRSKYPTREACLLPVLHLAQKEFGYISLEAMEYIAELIDISPAKVYGVATFYIMYNRKPMGKYHIQVCKNISCNLSGSEDVLKEIKSILKIDKGETTKDNMFTLSTVECLGACGFGPVVQINDDYHEQVTKDKIREIIEELKKK